MMYTYRSRGFTLIEVLVTVLIYGFLMSAIAALFITLIQQSNYRPAVLNSIDQVRVTGKVFVNEIRNAQSSNTGSFALNEASSTETIFFTSFDTNSSTTVKRVRYFVSNNTLYRGVVVPTGSPLSYDLGTETVIPVVTNLSQGAIPAFTYYDGNYAGTSTPLSQPVNVTQVAFVRMTLNVTQQDAKDASTTYLYTVGSTIRSLKSNLGN